eukprot:ANDGO_08048.mRNA.1 COMM domain-containing protein 5
MEDQILFPHGSIPSSLRVFCNLSGLFPDAVLKKSVRLAAELLATTATGCSSVGGGSVGVDEVLTEEMQAAANSELLALLVKIPEGSVKKTQKDDLANLVQHGEPFTTIVTACFLLLQQALRHSTMSVASVMEQIKVFGVPGSVYAAIEAVLSKRGDELRQCLAVRTAAIGLPHLANVRWRIDVVISTSTVNKIMRPVLQLELIVRGGAATTVELPMDKLAELRFAVATALKDLQQLEEHPILNIKPH